MCPRRQDTKQLGFQEIKLIVSGIEPEIFRSRGNCAPSPLFQNLKALTLSFLGAQDFYLVFADFVNRATN